MIFVTSPPAWFILSATACRPPALQQRIGSASKPRRRHRRFQTARCAQGRAISRAPFTSRMAAMSLGIYYWGARSACRRLTLAETKKSKGEQYGVGNSIVT
nr:hypothetical protein [Klebsiella pneumoniae subsp. pneumoniae]